MKIRLQVLYLLQYWQNPPDVIETEIEKPHPLAPRQNHAPAGLTTRKQEPLRPTSIVCDRDTYMRMQLEATSMEDMAELSRKELYGLPILVVDPHPRRLSPILFVQVERIE